MKGRLHRVYEVDLKLWHFFWNDIEIKEKSEWTESVKKS